MMHRYKIYIGIMLTGMFSSALAMAQAAPPASPAAQPMGAPSGGAQGAPDKGREARPWDIDRYHVDRVNLASDLPPYHSFYIWRTSYESVTGKKEEGGNVPVCRWDEERREMTPFAQLPVGTEVKLDLVREYFYHNYFRVVMGQDSRGHENEGWIDGAYIARDDADPRTYKPVKDKRRLHFPKTR